MNLASLRAHLRGAVLRDTALPYLWQDAELNKYLSDAQVQFARRTHALVDDVSDFTEIITAADQELYPLDDRILRVDEAGIFDDLGSYCALVDGTRGQIARRTTPGRPRAFTMQHTVDLEGEAGDPEGSGSPRHALRFDCVPDGIYTVQLRVARKPLCPLEEDRDVSELDEDYQLLLCDYAAWRALSNNRPEGANMAAAGDFLQTWDRGVRDAKRDIALLRAGADPRAMANWTGKRSRRR